MVTCNPAFLQEKTTLNGFILKRDKDKVIRLFTAKKIVIEKKTQKLRV